MTLLDAAPSAARYQEMKETARQWYSQAAQMFPKDGGAFNQLGVCASEPLEALYFYSRAYGFHFINTACAVLVLRGLSKTLCSTPIESIGFRSLQALCR